MKFEIPAGFDVEKVETTESHVVITLKGKERKLPKSWEEFCRMFTVSFAFRPKCDPFDDRLITTQVDIPCVMADFTEDPEISDAIIALISSSICASATIKGGSRIGTTLNKINM